MEFEYGCSVKIYMGKKYLLDIHFYESGKQGQVVIKR